MNFGAIIRRFCPFTIGLLVSLTAPPPAAANQEGEDPELLFYVPFEGTKEEIVSGLQPDIDAKGELSTGLKGNCLSLTGTEKGAITYRTSNAINWKSGTIMFWFKPAWSGTDSKRNRCLLWIKTKDPNQSSFLTLYRSLDPQSPHNLFVAQGWKNVIQVNGEKIFTPETWVHIALTWDAASERSTLYINAREIATAGWSDVSNDPAWEVESLKIGGYYEKDDAIDADYDELKVYSRTLTSEEIYNYYSKTLE